MCTIAVLGDAAYQSYYNHLRLCCCVYITLSGKKIFKKEEKNTPIQKVQLWYYTASLGKRKSAVGRTIIVRKFKNTIGAGYNES